MGYWMVREGRDLWDWGCWIALDQISIVTIA